jgi:hypothetical protein
MTKDHEHEAQPPIRSPRRRTWRPGRWTAPCGIALAWLIVIVLAVTKLRGPDAIVVAAAGFAATTLTFAITSWSDWIRWRKPVSEIAHFARTVRRGDPARAPVDLPIDLKPMVLDFLAILRSASKRATGRRPAGTERLSRHPWHP